MFVHLLLILPTIEALNVLVKEISIKQVNIDDEVIKNLFLNFPKDVKALRQRFQLVAQPSLGMLGPKSYPLILNTTPKPFKPSKKIPAAILNNLPEFVNAGQKRFKKIYSHKVIGQQYTRNGLKKAAKDGLDSNNCLRTIVIHVVDSLPKNGGHKDTFLKSVFKLATKN